MENKQQQKERNKDAKRENEISRILMDRIPVRLETQRGPWFFTFLVYPSVFILPRTTLYSLSPTILHHPRLSPARNRDRHFCFPPCSPLFSCSASIFGDGGGSTFQNVCKRPEHPAHPNTVHTKEKVASHPPASSTDYFFSPSRLVAHSIFTRLRTIPRVTVIRFGWKDRMWVKRGWIWIVIGRRSRPREIFAGLYRGPVGVVTIDSWPQLFRRLKKERLESWGGKTSFPEHIFLFVRGASQQATNNMGSFYVFPYMATGLYLVPGFRYRRDGPCFRELSISIWFYWKMVIGNWPSVVGCKNWWIDFVWILIKFS